MKINFLGFLIVSSITLSLMSCGDDLLPIEVSATEFVVDVAENPQNGQTLGSIAATTNRGILTFEIMSQDPAGALAVTPLTGKISVADASTFDFEERQFITAMIMVANKGAEDAIVARINITDVVD